MRPRTGFDTTIFVLVGLCLVLNAIELFAPSPWWYHAMAAVGVLGILALYLTLYRPVLPSGAPRPWWAVALLILSVGVACAGFTHMMPVQIAAHVMVWATVSTGYRAVLASAAITAAAFAGVRLGELAGGSNIPAATTGGILVLAFFAALGYGFWIRHAQRDANEQAALVKELRATRDALTSASRHAGQMEERARVSRELHDTLTQSVAALALVAAQAKQTRAPETIDLMHDMAQDALREARGVLAVLAPTEAEGDAARSVDGVVARFRRETALPIEVDAESVAVDVERELAIIRCLQEGLSNVRRHARAAAARVALRRDADTIELIIEDDGVGPPAEPSPGFGLQGMRDRVDHFDGGVDFGPRDGGGSRLRVWIRTTPDEDGTVEP